jgi:hypothetical protein
MTGPDDYHYFRAKWKGSATTQAACTNAFLQMDVYHLVPVSGWSLIKSFAASGSWLSGSCIKPVLHALPDFPLSTYLVAVSGRTSGATGAATVPVEIASVIY